jgi:thiol-disulfide isomerase/thioredoxin
MRIETEIVTRTDFINILSSNTGVVLFKFGAEWCGPCKKIESLLYELFDELPENVSVYVLDVDVCFDLFSYLKHKKMVNGIPCILAYYRGNASYAPDQCYAGTEKSEILQLFDNIKKQALSYY